MIRFYTQVIASDQPQLGFEYASAIAEAGLTLSIVPIMPAVIQGPPWDALVDYFMADLEHHRINVVCAPPGLVLGQKVRAGQMAAPGKVLLPPGSRPSANSMADIVYEPETALSRLYDPKITNIAITRALLSKIDQDEIAVLRAYQGVVVPFDNDAELFRGIGIPAFTIHPTADEMQRFFSEKKKAAEAT